MIRLAVVGDIGSGKSYIAKKFGYPVFNADVEVTKLYKTSKKCFVRLKKLLPQHIISFPIKKTELLKAIMINQFNLKKIIKVIHPEVRIKMNKFLIKNRNKKIVINIFFKLLASFFSYFFQISELSSTFLSSSSILNY